MRQQATHAPPPLVTAPLRCDTEFCPNIATVAVVDRRGHYRGKHCVDCGRALTAAAARRRLPKEHC